MEKESCKRRFGISTRQIGPVIELCFELCFFIYCVSEVHSDMGQIYIIVFITSSPNAN